MPRGTQTKISHKTRACDALFLHMVASQLHILLSYEGASTEYLTLNDICLTARAHNNKLYR